MLDVEIYILLFFTYAFLGWCMESFGGILKVKKFVNRGFLIGPYCPVYGFGVVAISILLKNYTNDIPALFILSTVICGTLEYATSYFMEKLFNARWWDYSQKRFNINGRICLETLIPFGVAGSTILCIANPFFTNIYMSIPDLVRHIITGILCVIYIIDTIVSFTIILSFKGETYSENDNTEEIGNKVKDKTEDALMKATSDVIVFSRKLKVTGLKFQRKVKYTRKNLSSAILETPKDLAEKVRKQRENINKKLEEEKEKFNNQIKLKKAQFEMKQKESKEILNRSIKKTKTEYEDYKERIDNRLKNIKVSSEEFTKQVVDKFKKESALRKRLMEAFPKLEVKERKKKK